MKELSRHKEMHTTQLTRVFALALLALVAVILPTVAGAANRSRAAAPFHSAGRAALKHRADWTYFQRPRLRHGQLTIEGTAANDKIALRLNAGHPDVLEVDFGDDGSADFSFNREHIARIAVDAGPGDDSVRIDESNGVFTDSIPTTIDGGDGNDSLAGGSGAETFYGGDGNDSIDGNKGADVAFMGAGDDVFVWDNGDGSDVVEGESGTDTMRFNGANVAEKFSLTANGHRLSFVRDIGNITMDTAGVEQVDLNALGGTDLVTVNDLHGTDVTNLNVDLAGTLGGTSGDGASDRVIINGTNADDTIHVSGDAAGVKVNGLVPTVAIQHQEANDELDVNGLAGNDNIDASALAASAIALTLDGGTGDDTIAGGQGVEKSLGGDGNDSIDGNKGADVAFMGAGDDVFVWDNGDGSDVVEGESGTDTMRFNGANVAEKFSLTANGHRLSFVRDIGNITMDTAGVEQVDLNALGGTDLVTVNDLHGTDVTNLNVDLAGTLGGTSGDGASDRVIVNGTNADDTIDVSGDPSEVKVSGLTPTVAIFHAEHENDRLDIDTLAGSDTVNPAGLVVGTIQLFVNGLPVS